MSSIFQADNKIFNFLNKVIDAVVISCLWIVFSIPVITAGASTTAFYYAYHKVVRQRRGYAWQEFWHGFKTNFKQATIAWLIMLGIAVILVTDYLVLGQMLDTEGFAKPLFGIVVAIGVLAVIWSVFVFSYLARFENTLKNLLRNSLIITLANVFWGILLVALFIAAGILMLWKPMFLFFAPALYGWISNKILEHIFRKYMTEEDLKEQEALDNADS